MADTVGLSPSHVANASTTHEPWSDSHEHEDRRTPLDRTIDRIGMGTYQWILLSLCGFGYLADNMWMQTNAIILPRVQSHFAVSDQVIGTVSSTMIAGMTLGALCWGACSDLIGRTPAFNATLFLTSVFGASAFLANSFVMLCVVWFLLGTAIGGSMPTDATLMLEHMPSGKQYLVIATGAYCSLGALLAAVAGLFVLPNHSCPATPDPCDRSQNRGWKYLVLGLGVFTLLMFPARILLFRLHESPRFLVHTGRPEEAMETLQKISKFNGKELDLQLEDVQDHCRYEINALYPMPPLGEGPKGYAPLAGEEDSRTRTNTSSIRSRLSSMSRASIVQPFKGWYARIRVLLSPRWRRTTLLLWAANCSINLAYTIFNIFLPKLLEGHGISGEGETSLTDDLWGVVIYTLGGCPGSLLAAFMVDTRLGHRWSLISSTLATAFLCAVFIVVRHPWAVNITTAGVNLSSTTMWAALYGWMPVLFATEVRGTACGTAIALSRVAGIVAPILGGLLISVDKAMAVAVSVVMYIVGAIFVLFMIDGDQKEGRYHIYTGHSVQ